MTQVRNSKCVGAHFAWQRVSFRAHFANFPVWDVDIDQVKEAVASELEGPGKLLGYRAMQKKIRQVHQLDVPPDLVHAVMYDLDLEGLENQRVFAKKRKPKGFFTSKGPNGWP